MATEKTFASNEGVEEILKKAREDSTFRALLFANPQEALAPFGVVIPGASGKDFMETVYGAFDRAQFYIWFNKTILDALRDGSDTTTPGPCVTAENHDDMDWDFEVTKYEL
jgi:hypothetical protein